MEGAMLVGLLLGQVPLLLVLGVEEKNNALVVVVWLSNAVNAAT